MEKITRVTQTTAKVLDALLKSKNSAIWGLEIVRQTGLKSGTVYPILDRLERLGWLTSSWESANERKGARRRTYVLTGDGIIGANEIFDLAPAIRTQPQVFGLLGQVSD